MRKQLRSKQERIIEAVREGLEGEAALEFIHQSGYAMSPSGIARHLRSMGGRGRIEKLIRGGRSNLQILETCFPGEDLSYIVVEPPTQAELFPTEAPAPSGAGPIYGTRKMAIKVPEDLYEAIRLAAKAERKSQNELIVEILTLALSQMPRAPFESSSQEK